MVQSLFHGGCRAQDGIVGYARWGVYDVGEY